MSNRRMWVGMLLATVLVLGWTYLVNYLERKYPNAAPPPPPLTAATQHGGTSATPLTVRGSRVLPTTNPVAATIGVVERVKKDDATAPVMGLKLDPYGASIASVTLNRFGRLPDKPEPFVFQRPYGVGAAEFQRPMATRQIILDGTTTLDLLSTPWDLVKAEPNRAEYAIRIEVAAEGQTPRVLRVSKMYDIRPPTDPSKGYELAMSHKLSWEPAPAAPTTQSVEAPATRQAWANLQAKLVFNGPNLPEVEGTRDVHEFIAGFNNENRILVEHSAAGSVKVDEPPQHLKSAKDSEEKRLPLMWAGVTSAYFDAIVRPAGEKPHPHTVHLRALAKPNDLGQAYLNMSLETAPITLEGQPGATASVPLEVYFGPRWRAVLEQPYYQQFPRSYDEALVLTSGPCGYCTFTWLINFLVTLLNWFHWALLKDWGLAIIALVVLVRLLLHPISKKSQLSMSKMSKLGPEIERLKKKYGDNKEELNREIMSLYKEHGAVPVMGCLPVLLQMPIWIALWAALQSTFELRHSPFLGFTWIHDLSQPDKLVAFEPFYVPLLSWMMGPINGLNLLPFLLGVVFWFQQKMTPKPATMSPEQEQQYKMMKWMTLLFPLFLYNGPSGLNIYIMTSTMIGIWEAKRVRDHIKAQEAAEKSGPVIVDAPAEAPDRKSLIRKKEEKPKPTGLMGWFAKLQQMAEEVNKETEKRKKQK